MTVWFICSSVSEFLSEPTATKVFHFLQLFKFQGCKNYKKFLSQIKMLSSPTYAYPPILICPNTWLDTEKTTNLGLSPNALKFSLGYIDSSGDKQEPENNTEAKTEFLSFYDKNNFSSFDDYLAAISMDMPSLYLSGQLYPKYYQRRHMSPVSGRWSFRKILHGRRYVL